MGSARIRERCSPDEDIGSTARSGPGSTIDPTAAPTSVATAKHRPWLADGLIELPLTTVHTGAGGGPDARLHDLAGRVPRLRGALSRAGLLSRVPLTPEGTTAREAVGAIEQAVAEGLQCSTSRSTRPRSCPAIRPTSATTAISPASCLVGRGARRCLDRLDVRPASLEELLAGGLPAAAPVPLPRRRWGL